MPFHYDLSEPLGVYSEIIVADEASDIEKILPE